MYSQAELEAQVWATTYSNFMTIMVRILSPLDSTPSEKAMASADLAATRAANKAVDSFRTAQQNSYKNT